MVALSLVSGAVCVTFAHVFVECMTGMKRPPQFPRYEKQRTQTWVGRGA